MKIEIDLDEEKNMRPLSIRERAGIFLLLTLFHLIYPVRYPYKMNEWMAQLTQILKG
jgi:hypothetical protein